MALVPLQVLPERLALEDKAAGRLTVATAPSAMAVAVTVTVATETIVALDAGGKILLRLR